VGGELLVAARSARPDAKLWGIPHGVADPHGPTGIAWQPELVLDCSMALLLPEVEAVIQRVATATLGQRIARIRTFGTYSCRDMVGWLGTKSEHSFANAIDIAAFDVADGKAISVLRGFLPADGGGAVPAAPARRAPRRHAPVLRAGAPTTTPPTGTTSTSIHGVRGRRSSRTKNLGATKAPRV
jgi:hypothetical protein